LKFLDKLDNWLYKYQEEQLHFFWAYSVTTLAIWWKPMLISGLIITVAKEIWDSKNPPHQFSWKDMRYGIAGWVIALLMVGSYVH
jgi:hypothetical protein